MFLRHASVLVLAAAPALAQTPATQPNPASVPEDVRAVYDGLLLPGVLDVMAQEGARHGELLAESIFGEGPVPERWTEIVSSLYDPAHMEAEVLASLSDGLAGEDTAAMRAFIESPSGRLMTSLELSAREAMLDEDVEQQAKEAAAVAMADELPRLDLIRRYAEANDLVETNVAGTMNSNYAYMMGLMDGGALRGEMTEGDVLTQVWSQEPQVRADTTEWVYSFLLMAYGPASDADIESLIAFSETEPGQALNRAVFDAFDERLQEVSRGLGYAAARYMTTEEL
ncbi:hypothetical protein [Rubellimicrobium roseum]|uniref:DUF2059 domain-containing protein n=1 Tax=Rubellimicrobium roseum TaxID=687525 RepID=A0A5C4N8H4_9RHOB|nr:hypothetical protein [Rubellimicrobium roseum]TNC65370.1 hypothetical protein FHG71_17605 [Rubellimicrobium roseum]